MNQNYRNTHSQVHKRVPTRVFTLPRFVIVNKKGDREERERREEERREEKRREEKFGYLPKRESFK
jgi:hypothetical protein